MGNCCSTDHIRNNDINLTNSSVRVNAIRIKDKKAKKVYP